MFDELKQAKEAIAKAKEFQALAIEFSHLDADHNGKVDLQELLTHLEELKVLVEKEGSEVEAVAVEARKEIGDKLREILKLGVVDVDAMRARLAGLVK